MKKLVFCCLCILALMACGERNTITGRWAMEIDGTDETSIKMPDDTIVSPELRFEYDTVYMDVRTSEGSVRSQCIGIYTIKDDYVIITDSYGKQRKCKFILKDDILTVMDKDNPEKIVMRLRRIKE
ncbi:MAG: hypothetical protein ACK5KN_04870 [Dysgonomonas sp.]|uniref:hypothetical protein n=1 Tax=unclassified Dysgonomonas TaxID=2630389 RepID=UPI0025C228F3|nr:MULTISPECIES: hypothetical protein [unclassified Dysgonomonas]MDR2004186.1 hypothetical protein [Prevotella sp.]HMM04352.1 hypothetical protein [Dysgonomonas sp.]